MIGEPQEHRRTLSFHAAALALLAAALPAVFCAAVGVSEFLTTRYTGASVRGVPDWISVPPEKLAQPVALLVVLVSFVGCACAALLVQRYAGVLNRRLGRFSATASLIAIGCVAATGVSALALLAVSWRIPAYGATGISLLTLGLACLHGGLRLVRTKSIPPVFALLPLLIGIAPLCYALLFTPFRVPNEFLGLPEVTILHDGERIDNLRFIDSTRLEGLYVPDPRKKDETPPFSVALKPLDRKGVRLVQAFADQKPYRFWLDPSSPRIEIHGPFDADEFEFLRTVVEPGVELGRLDRRFVKERLAELRLANRRYTPRELNFLEANLPELQRQLVLGRFFYHHAFIFLPTLRGVLGGTVTFASQYGKGLTQFFSMVLARVPEKIRFNAYLTLLYASYPLYLALVLVIASRFGLSRWGLVFVGAFTVLSYLVTDLEDTRLGVGLAPWRHFFDAVGLLTLYVYARSGSRPWGLLLAAITGILTYWSRETGLFLSTGIVFALLVHSHAARSRFDLAVAPLCAASAAAGWLLGDPRVSSNLTMILLGINTPSLPPGFVEALALAVVGAGVLWWTQRPTAREGATASATADWAFVGGVLVYAAASGIYLLWYPRPHHLILTLPVIGLALAVAYRYRFPSDEAAGASIAATTVAATLGLVALLGLARGWEGWREARIFEDHVVYKWDFPDGWMLSTGQPQLLRESIDLIRRREPSNSVNILSPWEVVLLPFAGKYKPGPFLVSFDSMFSDKEIEKLSTYLVGARSKVLFVDTRIMRGEYELPLSKHAYMTQRIIASRLRIGAQATLRRVFEILRPCYRLVEEGPLISAYVRKANARMTALGCRADD